MKCCICGTEDLFSAVTRTPACSLCVGGFNMRTPVTLDAVAAIRERLGLAEGEYRAVDVQGEASALLGRTR